MTTTLPDGSFDIFRWTAWRAEASLMQLYFSFGQMETLELAYQLRIERGEGDEIENALKVEFYLSLQADILTEIAVRLTPTGYRSLN
jgi:hypothetical protein